MILQMRQKLWILMPEKGTTKQQNFIFPLLPEKTVICAKTVFRYCVEHDVVLLEQKVNTKTLEDVFLELTGNEEVREA